MIEIRIRIVKREVIFETQNRAHHQITTRYGITMRTITTTKHQQDHVYGDLTSASVNALLIPPLADKNLLNESSWG